jgi:hypothetical protein
MAAILSLSANALQLSARPTAAARSVRRVRTSAAASAKPVLGGVSLGHQLRRNGCAGAARMSAARPAARASAFRVSAAAEEAAEKEEEAAGDKGADIRQLLGVRGGSKTEELPLWKIRLQLTKPVTWVPLIWGVLCGAAASGHFTWTVENIEKSLLCMFMSGPLLTGRAPYSAPHIPNDRLLPTPTPFTLFCQEGAKAKEKNRKNLLVPSTHRL